MISGQMRVDLESFERWYANQVKHKKVNGEEPGIELKKTSYSFREAANLLGVHDADIYVAWKENDLETFTVDYVKRIRRMYLRNGIEARINFKSWNGSRRWRKVR